MQVNTSNKVISKLGRRLQADAELHERLIKSLKKAKSAAGNRKSGLDPRLFAALEWPEDIAGYLEYLEEFSKWCPQQSSDPAWTDPGTDEQQEVYDRLCHFYYLIDQKVGRAGRVVEDDAWFSQWLVDYANAWGSFLDTTQSFSDKILQTFIDDAPKYRMQDSMVDGRPNAASGWLTFNQFFARELNPGLRPIASPTDNAVVVSPADCTYRESFPIGPDSSLEQVTVKKTHKFANVQDLLEGSQYADAFANGTFSHYFLGPYSYHRFHTPVAGQLLECRAVSGKVFLEVNLAGRQFDAPDSAQGGYEFNQARGIVILDTSGSAYGDIGLVGVVPIGMCQVSSVQMTAQPGSNMLKGDEFGYFLFGGSDIILLFQEGTDPRLMTGGSYRHYGTTVATCTPR